MESLEEKVRRVRNVKLPALKRKQIEKSLTGNKDADFLILNQLDDASLLSFCMTSKYGRNLCQDETFWRNRFFKTFGRHKKSPDKTWKNFYLKLVYLNDKYTPEKAFYEAAVSRDKDIIDYYIANGVKDWDIGLVGAAKGGQKELVDFFISKGAQVWFEAANRAAENFYENFDLINFFREKVSSRLRELFVLKVIEGAARGGIFDREYIEQALDEGITEEVWKAVLEGALMGGKEELAQRALYHVRKPRQPHLGALGGNMNLVKLLEKDILPDSGMRLAAEGGHFDIVDYFISRGANDWVYSLQGAKFGGNKDMIKFFEEKVKKN